MSVLPKVIASDPEFAARRRRYEANRAYYAGEHPIARQRRQQRTPRNYAAVFVDTVTAHMGSGRISFGDGAVADALEHYVAETLEAQDRELLDYDTETSCAVDGDAAWKVTWDGVEGRVRVAQVDPARLWARGRPDNPRELVLVAEQYDLTPADAPVLFDDATAARLAGAFGARRKGRITEAWTRESWQVWVDEALMLEVPNPYGGLLPYVIFPNWRVPGRLWGTGDPERIAPLQDLLNTASSDLDWITELAGQIVVLEGVSDTGNLVVRPGAVWEMPEDSRAYVLDLLTSGSLAARLEYVRDLRAQLHAVGRIPETALGDHDQVASGAALQIQLGPLIRLVHRKRLNRSAALRRRAELIVALGVQFGALPALVDVPRPLVLWDDAIPSDRADDLANAEAELRLGRDVAAVLREIGVEDPATEIAARERQIASGIAGPISHGGIRTRDRQPPPRPRPGTGV